ncbi:MAG TPA: hypothetical protein VK720_05765 [Terracidiphilus sp.]|jgi:hypothetical protein|nr:hypothetical protein [Terracidiphilus sp.]
MSSTDLIKEDSPAASLSRISSSIRQIPALDLLISCAISLPLASTTALEPAYHDGAIFMYVGEMWRRGLIPYLQVFDNKPPGIFFVTAIASAFPHSFWILSFILFLFAMGCILSVKKTLQIAGAPERTVFWGTIATALIVNLRYYGAGSSITEPYMLAPMAASMCAFAYALRSGKLRYVFLAGVCSGIACAFKPFALSVFAAQVVFVIFHHAPPSVFPGKVRAILGSILANIAGAAAAWAPIFAYFALHGALKQMLDASFFYNLHYGMASQPKPLELLTSVAENLVPLSSTLGCIFIGLVALRRQPSRTPGKRSALWDLTLLWFAFSLVLVFMAGRGYRHYYLSLTPSLSVAAALVLWSLEDLEIAKNLRLAFYALLLSPIVMTQLPVVAEVVHDYNAAAHHSHDSIPVEVAATELKRIAPSSSTVFVWGFEPWMLSDTHLRSAFRFPTAQYIYDSPRAYDVVGREILSGMQTTPPDFVVLTPWFFNMGWPHQSDPVQDEFMAIVHKSYAKVWEKDSFSLYKRN